MAGRRGRSRRQVLGAAGAAGLGAVAFGLSRGRLGGLPDVTDRRGPDSALPFLTPTEGFYKFTNGPWPGELGAAEAQLTVSSPGGSRAASWEELLRLPTRKLVRTLSCDGNGYLGDRPPGLGCQMTPDPEDSAAHPEPEQWTWRFGGIGTAEWDVLSLRELFEALAVPMQGSHLRLEGRDGYQRWFPIERAAGDELLVAVGMNGQPLPHKHGAPARLIASGQYGAMSVKWLRSLAAGPRVGARPYDGGSLEDFPVKPLAFASAPLDGAVVPRGVVTLHGAAYAGRHPVKQVLLSVSGEDPVPASLVDPGRAHVWSRWSAELAVHEPGEVVVEIACADDAGRYSMPQSPFGDAQGYGGLHRLHLTVT